jgi:hypothetical protein
MMIQVLYMEGSSENDIAGCADCDVIYGVLEFGPMLKH